MTQVVTERFGARRFTSGGRPDCFEVFDTVTGECASFPGRKHECEREAARLNATAVVSA